jgi:hypothetical protein
MCAFGLSLARVKLPRVDQEAYIATLLTLRFHLETAAAERIYRRSTG